MKKIIQLLLLTILLQSCNKQIPPKEFYSKDFNWTITIPENFETVTSEEWAKLQNKGADAIEKTYNQEVINQSKTIFIFKSDQFNYMESNYQPFDTATEGNYLESWKNVHDMLYNTFKTQMPNTKIDTLITVEKIDGLEFQTSQIKAEYPNEMTLNVFMFSRLFEKKEFTVNIMYVDQQKGEQMLDAWKNSKFTK